MHHLTPFNDIVAAAIGIGSTEAELRLTELEKFLRVASEAQESLQPSRWVDDAWHALIEDDATYRSFLRAHNLPYVRHVPSPRSAVRYARTTALIAERYGSLNADAWAINSPADCGQCGSAGNEG
jgi:hypothetical protein